MDLSIVIPVYNEKENIIPLHEQLKRTLKKLDKSHEIIFVDDGSTDSTPGIIKGLKKKDSRLKTVLFKRNFGKAAALMAGWHEAKGDIVLTMDGDLQDDPKEIPRFIKKIESGYELVNGWKYRRHDPLTKTMPSRFFNFLTRLMTGVKVHDSNCGFKAYRKEVVKSLRIYGELHRYIPSLTHWMGFRVGEIKVKHRPRKYGKSKYGVTRLMKGFLDLITIKFLNKFAERPLHLFGPVGILLALIGFIAGLYLVVVWCMGRGIGDRPLLILSVLLIIVGIQTFSIGLIGEIIINSRKKE
ncbi:MAG: glycosyltransferase family 2 protein [Candidatus Woesearchaeota archaeon]